MKIWFLIFSIVLCGCATTVIPKRVHDTRASFDGNDQNSGFLGFDSEHYGLLTPHGKARYNELVKIYGNQFHPTIKIDDGISSVGNVWRIDKEHLAKYQTMQRWLKEGRKPNA